MNNLTLKGSVKRVKVLDKVGFLTCLCADDSGHSNYVSLTCFDLDSLSSLSVNDIVTVTAYVRTVFNKDTKTSKTDCIVTKILKEV